MSVSYRELMSAFDHLRDVIAQLWKDKAKLERELQECRADNRTIVQIDLGPKETK